MVERSKNLGRREGLVMKRRRFLRGTMRREGIFLQGGYSIFRGFHDSLFERGESVTFSRALSKWTSASGVTGVYSNLRADRSAQASSTEWKRFYPVRLSVCLPLIDLRVYDRGLWEYVTLGIPLEDDGIPVYQNVRKEIRLKWWLMGVSFDILEEEEEESS